MPEHINLTMHLSSSGTRLPWPVLCLCSAEGLVRPFAACCEAKFHVRMNRESFIITNDLLWMINKDFRDPVSPCL